MKWAIFNNFTINKYILRNEIVHMARSQPQSVFVGPPTPEQSATDERERAILEQQGEAKQIALIGRAEDELQEDTNRNRRLGQNTGIVVFDVQPIVSESGSATYAPIDDIRQAASMLIYMGSPSRDFTINAKFVSRTRAEATTNKRYVQTLRSWRMPEASGGGFNMTTPSRLTLLGLNGWFNQVAVRMTNLTIETPDDVDYIDSYDDGRVPIVWPVTITLKEARSPSELQAFEIEAFRDGLLPEW